MTPAHGSRVLIRAAVPHPVLYGPGRWLDGTQEVIWTPFLDTRLATGEVEIVSAPAPSQPEKE